MTRRMNVSSTKWTDILLIFLITRLSQSQTTTLPLGREMTNSNTTVEEFVNLPSGNHTILRKSDRKIESVHLTTLNNDMERQTPFYFTTPTTKSTIESTATPHYDSLSTSAVITTTNSTDDQRYLSYNLHKQLPINNNNNEIDKIKKLQKINNSIKTEKSPDYNVEINNNNNDTKHLFEKLLIHSQSLFNKDHNDNDNEKAPDHAELINKDDNQDEWDEQYGTVEITTASSRFVGDISLINDTMVNYRKNTTKLLVKPRNPKNDVEIIHNNPILPKTMRIIKYEESKHNKNDTKNNENEDEVIEIKQKLENTTQLFKSDENNSHNNNNNNTINVTPKGRTISIGEINRFSSTEEKAAIGLTKEYSELGFTKDEHAARPYPLPYFKTTIDNMNKSLITNESDEIFTLENTISKNVDDKKSLINQQSIIVDNNSIQQIKSLNQKRSGNNSDSNIKNINNNNNTSKFIINSTTESIMMTPSNVKIYNDNINSTSSLKLNDNVPESVVNDIPRNNEIRKATLDLTENRLIIDNNNNMDKNFNLSTSPLTTIISITSTTRPTTTIETTVETIKNNTEDDKLLIDSVSNGKSIIENSLSITDNDTTKVNDIPSTTLTYLNSTMLISQTISTNNQYINSTVLPALVNSTTNSITIITSSTLPSIDKNKTDFNASNLKKWTLPSNGRGFDVETTASGVEYEFVGLSDTTEYSDTITERSTLKNLSLSSTTSSPRILLSNSSLPSSITSQEDSTVITTLANTIINDSISESTTTLKNDQSMNITTVFNYSEDSILQTTDNSVIDDTTILPTTISSVDSDDHRHVINIFKDVTTISTMHITTNLDSLDNVTDNNAAKFPSEFSTTIQNSLETNAEEAATITISNSSTTEYNDGTSEETISRDNPIILGSSASPERVSTTLPTPPLTTSVVEFSPENVPLLVGIVIEGTWADVCPHLSSLKQSLAKLLTVGMDKVVLPVQIIYQANPCIEKIQINSRTIELIISTILLYVVDENGNFDPIMTKSLPALYSRLPFETDLVIRSFQLVQDADSGNAIAVVVISCVAFICLVLLASLLFIMRKRQTRFNYGERCRPVSLDAYSLDSVSAYNSVRRKGAARASKRSYGNPTFEDSTAVPSHPLNFAGLSSFCNEENTIYEEFTSIPQVSARIDELPPGAEVKNRYANVVPLPETRVPLSKINNNPMSEYINASYVRGPKNATKYYIACQAPIESTIIDFWRMIWEQQSKVIIMLTDLIENGVEKCAEYVPPSEVTDCHRLYGDFQVTVEKRETKEKYAISTLNLKNLETNTYREISHIWYLWPTNGVQTDAAGLIAVILEARALQRGGPGPIIVHCSPGTGRTGTLIALDLGIRQYEITRTVDVPRVVYTIRRDRAGAVQTKEQYGFIYKALNLYATKLAGGGLEST